MPPFIKKSLLATVAVAALLGGGYLIYQRPFVAPVEQAAPAKTGVFFPEVFRLSNGLTVVVVTNRRAPLVTQMIWYKIGSADEPAGKSGIAHLLEHLMFKGTATVPAGQFSRIIAQNGGRDNAFTSWDYTAYHQVVAKSQLETAIRLEADRMTGLQLTDPVVDPELRVVLEERRQRTENNPSARLNDTLRAALFVHHPYGTPIIGWEQEIARLTRADAESFYQARYAPGNAILVLSGDINAAEARPLVEKYYGPIPARPMTARPVPDLLPLEVDQRITLRDPLVSQPSLERTYRAPSYIAPGAEHAYALQVLSEILGGGPTSRLYKSLVVDQKLAVAAGASYSPYDRFEGTFSFHTVPRPGIMLDQAEKALLAEIKAILGSGVTAEEVRRAQTNLQREAIFARDSATGPAYILGMVLAIGQTIQDVEHWPEHIAAVTPDQVNAAARAVLSQKGVVTGVLLPSE